MAHVEDGEKYYIRKEYTEVSELQNSSRKENRGSVINKAAGA